MDKRLDDIKEGLASSVILDGLLRIKRRRLRIGGTRKQCK
jgi:hypothetical protein